MHKQGDIVLIPLPFTDLSSQKRRPVIIVSNNAYNQKTDDIIVVAMTSNPKKVDYSFTITSSDLAQGSLNRPGKVRVDKIYTLSQKTVVKTFGRVHSNVMGQIRKFLQNLISDANYFP
ncbi:transcriptional modulator of MazE/toxin, MazF [Candidatus Vecturithrix granuli]|uniref:Transcriptional modulator of MazE/toxin, MazF n=1 Tax=Vecturithrix granuli TaxID=1499967 RepID=A0A081C4Z0_VECG1|nr:transcriptional modulator of MazE/toxin, MazF [Candidatus Vecturithrix granuli]